MKNCFIGVDPGASGGLAAILVSPSSERVVFRSLDKLDDNGIIDWLLGLVEDVHEVGEDTIEPDAVAVLEWINPAMFGTDKASMSKLYGSFTALRMALVACGILYQEEKPVVWQRGLDILPKRKDEDRTRWKKRLLRIAEGFFPGLKITLGTSDALLIAEYCRRRYGVSGESYAINS